MAPNLLKFKGSTRPRTEREVAVDSLIQRGVDHFGWPDHGYEYTKQAVPLQTKPKPSEEFEAPAQEAEGGRRVEGMPVPPGVDIAENIRLARSNGHNPLWFYEQTRNGGPWDYKQIDPKYEAFGNFNYGLTGLAAGFSEDTLERMAGWAQTRAGTSDPKFGEPAGFLRSYSGVGGEWPYGDDPRDNRWMRRGFDHHDAFRASRTWGGGGW